MTTCTARNTNTFFFLFVCLFFSWFELGCMLRPTVRRPACLGIKHPDFYYCQTVAGLLIWGDLSDERTGLSFATVAGPRQHNHSRVRVPWDSWPYFTASDSRLPFSSPPTTRRDTVEVFDPASTRDCVFVIITTVLLSRVWVAIHGVRTGVFSYSLGTDSVENTAQFYISNIVLGTSLFAKPLLSNGFRIFAHSAIVTLQRIYMAHYCKMLGDSSTFYVIPLWKCVRLLIKFVCARNVTWAKD
jgi:hypothetical protein